MNEREQQYLQVNNQPKNDNNTSVNVGARGEIHGQGRLPVSKRC